jgi:hypothetical protein
MSKKRNKQADPALEGLPNRKRIENHRLGSTVAGHLAVENQQRQQRLSHNPMKLAVAIQFWDGDRDEALKLARLLADIETSWRGDVALILAMRFDVREDSRDILSTKRYCEKKFPTWTMRSKRVATGHPDGCFGLWAGTAENCHEAFLRGEPFDNVFFVESEGRPTRFDWIDQIKRQHQVTLDAGKYVTGPRMEGNQFYPTHINGSCVLSMHFFRNAMSLHSCPRGIAWDCFHARTMVCAAGPGQGIINLYGAHDLSLSVFKTMARDYAWVASVKDDSAHDCAKTLLEKPWRKLYLSAWPEQPKTKKGKRR